MPDAVRDSDILHEAAALIREDPVRRGALLEFGLAGQLVMTGDLHGNLRNFDKLQRFCKLGQNPARLVILHELIHAEPNPPGAADGSIELLVQAAKWKCEFPDNVYFLQSNHELSQLCRHEITKGGRSVLEDFDRGVAERYAQGSDDVLAAVSDYVAALPLAARTANGIFLAHSLPDAAYLETFNPTDLERDYGPEDMQPGGFAYNLVWGRFQSREAIDRFAEKLNVDVCIVGHTPQEMGHGRVGRLLIMASDHQHGVFLPIDLRRRYTAEELEGELRKFVAVE